MSFKKIQEETYKVLKRFEGLYKRYLDRKDRLNTKLRRGYLVFCDRPPYWAMTEVDTMIHEDKSKTLPNTTGPYRVLNASDETITMN